MGATRVRLTMNQERIIDAAYMLEGGKMPQMKVRKEIAKKFGCDVGKITERFKYLAKREKKPRGAGDGFRHHPLSVSFHSPSPPVQDISEPLSLLLGAPTYCMLDHEKECMATSPLDLPDTSTEEQLVAALMDQFTYNADFSL
ncbi:hypothetical protein V565_064700 [Rhizoctonia solani 123E]|uniref:Uncharacterized protein n=1 Tax=Rhizoctonia solani 123E TaxID=1423351 RepID=A0A074RWK8_9AGAM|nr:hypothetical protein V565_064700 [Rhizoctonia solani 123E]